MWSRINRKANMLNFGQVYLPSIRNSMKFWKILSFSLLSWLFSCTHQDPNQFAQTVIDGAITRHGGKNFEQFIAEFDFRDKHYLVQRNGGKYRYERSFKDSTGNETRDVVTNETTVRYLNGQKANVPDSMLTKYRNSVNSIAYFALLPQPLNDASVIKQYLGEVQINQQPYFKLKITFKKEGGGKDFDDEFVYWIHRKDYTLDYFAYLFHVDGGGMRFRQAINPQEKSGIRFQDYINYEPILPSAKLEELDIWFVKGRLKELSRIENKNLKVSTLH